MAFIKQINIDAFETLLKNIAIDCDLFKAANETTKNSINCLSYDTDFNQVYENTTNTNNSNSPIEKVKKTPKKTQKNKNVSVPKVNMNNIISNMKTKPKKKKMKKLNLTKQYTTKSVTAKKRKTKNGCPLERIPDDDGKCPPEYKYRYLNPKGQMCCYKRRQRRVT